VKDLNLSMRKAMFGFDPKKHRVCRDAESKDESKYGHFTFGLAGDLEKIGGADPQGRVCYQKAFLDEATRHISAALNGTEFNPSGTNTTIPVGHCDFNVNYVGTDRSKYKRDAEREIFITSSFKSHHETTPHTINTLLFPVEFTETQWVQGQKTTQDLFDYTFKGRQTSTDELFRDYVTKNPNGKRHADLVLTLAKAAYIYCSDN
jgi:hypothetical protein